MSRRPILENEVLFLIPWPGDHEHDFGAYSPFHVRACSECGLIAEGETMPARIEARQRTDDGYLIHEGGVVRRLVRTKSGSFVEVGHP